MGSQLCRTNVDLRSKHWTESPRDTPLSLPWDLQPCDAAWDARAVPMGTANEWGRLGDALVFLYFLSIQG